VYSNQSGAEFDRQILTRIFEIFGRNRLLWHWGTDLPISFWDGVTVNTDGRVIQLDLSCRQLHGPIPAEIGNLTELYELNLLSNALTGNIPPELCELTALTSLYLSGNQLSGSIPAEVGNLTTLTELYLSQNQLSGKIPAELGNLSALIYLDLSKNKLEGCIPPQLVHLSALGDLNLSHNQFEGSIPHELSWILTRNAHLIPWKAPQQKGRVKSTVGAQRIVQRRFVTDMEQRYHSWIVKVIGFSCPFPIAGHGEAR